MRSKFEDFYKPNINWMDTGGVDVLSVLEKVYPEYYTAAGFDTDKLKKDIISSEPVQRGKNAKPNKAAEAFKTVFKMPYITTEQVFTEDLKGIIEDFGKKIVAHGVEESKGGMYNLLMMCMCDEVRISSNSWGAFVPGLPNISPLRHGPYYLILTPLSGEKVNPVNNVKLSAVSRILVPFEKNKSILAESLLSMNRMNLVSDELMVMFVEKLVSYEEYYVELLAYAQLARAASTIPLTFSFPMKDVFTMDVNAIDSHLMKSVADDQTQTDSDGSIGFAP